MTRSFLVRLTFDNDDDDECGGLPDAGLVRSVLEFSTAAEAISEGASCTATMELIEEEELKNGM